MSRFTNLKRYLSFSEAVSIYLRLKTKNRKNIRISKLNHPFTMRNNRFDYGTFEEVIVKESYRTELDFIPASIIDGGGNIGLTAAYFATQFPRAAIVTVEPDKENYDLLKENISHYQNIEAWNGGIWNKSTHLVVKDSGMGNNAFTVEESETDSPNKIEAWGIHDIIEKKKWPRCDLVKLDVEGSEKEIFSENVHLWLPKTRVLIIELHDRMKKGCSRAVFSAMAQYNFSVEIKGENLHFFNEEIL